MSRRAGGDEYFPALKLPPFFLNRLRVKSSRMESLRSMLQKWTAIEINNPDEREIIVT